MNLVINFAIMMFLIVVIGFGVLYPINQFLLGHFSGYRRWFAEKVLFDPELEKEERWWEDK